MQLTFRPLALDDLVEIRRWLNAPHVYEWWGVSSGPGSLGGPGGDAATAEQVYEKYAPGIASDDATTRRRLIELDGRAVGLIQHHRLEYEPAYAADIDETAPFETAGFLAVRDVEVPGSGPSRIHVRHR